MEIDKFEPECEINKNEQITVDIPENLKLGFSKLETVNIDLRLISI